MNSATIRSMIRRKRANEDETSFSAAGGTVAELELAKTFKKTVLRVAYDLLGPPLQFRVLFHSISITLHWTSISTY